MDECLQGLNENDYKEEKEKYLSCELLERGMICFSKGIRHCCGELPVEVNRLEIQEYDNNFDNDINSFVKKFIDKKQEIINRNRLGKKTMCTGCSYLREDYWAKEKKITSLNFSFDSICNFRCQYCYTVRNQDYKPNDGRAAYEVIEKLLTSNYIRCEDQIIYASGEVTIQPDLDKILDLLQCYDVSFFSNASNYNDRIHEIIKRKNSSMVVSVDSGTRKTFKKVKGVDWFERVWTNIGRYAEDGGHVIVKYILMEENKDRDNIDGFIAMCVKNNIRHIRVSRDWNYEDGGMEGGVVIPSVRLMKKAMENGITVHNDGTTAF